ncbi:hypothetical protein BVRB_4g073730 [Beta vulgaris subsp. vulgaris]|nr:hypothetical protein BVRB_4g073730 [Beta vulgaris subsp. vulgaris]
MKFSNFKDPYIALLRRREPVTTWVKNHRYRLVRSFHLHHFL